MAIVDVNANDVEIRIVVVVDAAYVNVGDVLVTTDYTLSGVACWRRRLRRSGCLVPPGATGVVLLTAHSP